MKSSCFECQDRKVGCHGSCEKYIDFKEKYGKELLDRNQAKRDANDYGEVRWGKRQKNTLRGRGGFNRG